MRVTLDHWSNELNGEYYGSDLFCLQSCMSELSMDNNPGGALT